MSISTRTNSPAPAFPMASTGIATSTEIGNCSRRSTDTGERAGALHRPRSRSSHRILWHGPAHRRLGDVRVAASRYDHAARLRAYHPGGEGGRGQRGDDRLHPGSALNLRVLGIAPRFAAPVLAPPRDVGLGSTAEILRSSGSVSFTSGSRRSAGSLSRSLSA